MPADTAHPICKNLSTDQVKKVCAKTPASPLCNMLPGGTGGGTGGGNGGGTPSLPLPTPSQSANTGNGGGCVLVLLCRVAPGTEPSARGQGLSRTAAGYDSNLGALLTWGMVQR